jgi:TonB family protein
LFEFTIPTESAPQSSRSLVASIAVHGLAILLLFAIRFSGASGFRAAPQHFTLIAPARETPVMPPEPQAPRPSEFRRLPPTPARLTIPAVLNPAPAIEIPKPVFPELPSLAVSAPVNIPEVKPAVPMPPPKPIVKAAGFESFETLAKGPVHGAVSPPGSFESAHSSEGAPIRPTIARQGAFVDASTSSSSVALRKVVTSAAFGDATVEKSPVARTQMSVAARLTPVEIIAKPRPAYTAEARAKNIEGEVLLEVQFEISGAVRVLRVVRGLGAGLDETAIVAAQGIRFRPATRDGTVTDSTALVHIIFQLAN